jgi:hypothetical protein
VLARFTSSAESSHMHFTSLKCYLDPVIMHTSPQTITYK